MQPEDASDDDDDDDDDGNFASQGLAADNAAAALGRACEFMCRWTDKAAADAGGDRSGGSNGEVHALWGAWLERLPLRCDAVESARATCQLCRLLTKSGQRSLRRLLGTNLERLPKALNALAGAAALQSENADAGDDSSVPAMIAQTLLALRRGVPSLPVADFERAWGQADGQARATLLALVAAFEAQTGASYLQTIM
eukprot:TRINITY_DN5845_c0_g1_i1.p1 TRINITY_DN5845_c0_g1~~TRINITY_DN5845_c0_g1_i1.p1  ORF type:complete len:225 (+),score=76.47 TRINITY_DN5845_c0_g1_i1:84-677(+)